MSIVDMKANHVSKTLVAAYEQGQGITLSFEEVEWVIENSEAMRIAARIDELPDHGYTEYDDPFSQWIPDAVSETETPTIWLYYSTPDEYWAWCWSAHSGARIGARRLYYLYKGLEFLFGQNMRLQLEVEE